VSASCLPLLVVVPVPACVGNFGAVWKSRGLR
jgi:hypothetical protein